MASSIANTSMCAICNKIAGSFTCRGCNLYFCANHVLQHRQILGKQMDEIVLEHDQLQQALAEKTEELCPRILKQQIDDWEKEAIEIIRKEAIEIRKKLSTIVDRYRYENEELLKPISEQLKKCREEDNFVETDLTIWMNELNKIKQDLIATPNTAIILQNFNENLQISKLIIVEKSDEIFHQSIGSINIIDNGRAVTHGVVPMYGSARGQKEYSSGCHLLSFQIEYAANLNDLFLGITSKTDAIQSRSSAVLSAYGWSGHHCIYEKGEKEQDINYEDILRTNETIQLLINCDERTICITNTVREESHEIEVDEGICPFPWEFTVCLANWGDRIRLLLT